jgi:hypothetical protein
MLAHGEWRQEHFGRGRGPENHNVTSPRAEVEGDRGVSPAWLWVGILAVTGSSGVVLAVLARTLAPSAFAACATVLTASLVLSVLPGALQLRTGAICSGAPTSAASATTCVSRQPDAPCSASPSVSRPAPRVSLSPC